MKRHRSLANKKRLKFNLPLLPPGPPHNPDNELMQYSRHQQFFSEYEFDAALGNRSRIFRTGSGTEIALSIGDFSPPFAELQAVGGQGSNARSTAASTPASPQRGIYRNPEHASSSPGQQDEVGPLNSAAAAPQEIDYESSDAVFGHEEVLRQENAPSAGPVEYVGLPTDVGEGQSGEQEINRQEESRQESAVDEGDETADWKESNPLHISEQAAVVPQIVPEGQIWRPAAFLRFQHWCEENRKWIEMAVDFGLKKTVMQRILTNVESPYKTWVTVTRNLAKYSSLDTRKYFTCNGHMLLSSRPRSNLEQPELEQCRVCRDRRMSGTSDTVEYFCLRERMRQWFLSEKTCSDLFSYLHEAFQDRQGSRSNDAYYADFLDGSVGKNIIERRGGFERAKYDIFLDISADGFDVFNSTHYDCWPVVLMIHNLHPRKRFLMRNSVPVMFIKGPREPVLLDTFLLPFVEEVQELNADGGTEFEFYDGKMRRVMVHLLWVKGDGPASQKLGGFVGARGKRMCRVCNIEGHKCNHCGGYYFPSRIRISENEDGPRLRTKVYYNPSRLPLRTPAEITLTFQRLDNPQLSKTHRREMTTRTGVKSRTVLYDIPGVIPFHSFPLDLMHLTMNLLKDMMSVWKGEHSGLKFCEGPLDFVINENDWKVIDSEMNTLGTGTSHAVFGRKMRDTTCYSAWKAEECRMFISHYALIFLGGYLPQRYLIGLRHLSETIELCMRPYLSQKDVRNISKLALAFFEQFERDYFGFDEDSVHLCKSTVHGILHIAETIDRCGPPVLYSQFWMERFVGYAKDRLNATNKAAESLTENARLSESFKLYFQEHFASEDPNAGLNNAVDETSSATNDNEIGNTVGVTLLTPRRLETLTSAHLLRFRLKRLLVDYAIRTKERLSMNEALEAVQSENITMYGRIRKQVGDSFVEFGSSLLGRSNKLRADYLVAGEFWVEECVRDVYYGKVLFFFEYLFTFAGRDEKHLLYLCEWAGNLVKDRVGEVYVARTGTRVFSSPRTVEWVGSILHGIGIVEHGNPSNRSRRTYFIDPQQRSHCLLHANCPSPDGVDRRLSGVATTTSRAR